MKFYTGCIVNLTRVSSLRVCRTAESVTEEDRRSFFTMVTIVSTKTLITTVTVATVKAKSQDNGG